MGRCFGCHQDSCGYRKNCPCVCHREDITVVTPDASSAVQPKLADHPYAGNKEQCPKCHHPMWKHRKDYHGFQCYERMSYDNNDFCGCAHGAPKVEEPTYTFYAVADRDDLTKAKWYRTYSANGSSGWVSDLDNAKVWVKRSSAKGKCTNLGPSARLVEFEVTKVTVVDNSDSVKKAAEAKRAADERRQKREAEAALERAQADFDRAQKRLDALKGK